MTTAIEATLQRLAQDAIALDLRWTLIGGFAVSARAEPRFTRDVDICALMNDKSGAEATCCHPAIMLRDRLVSAVNRDGHRLTRPATITSACSARLN